MSPEQIVNEEELSTKNRRKRNISNKERKEEKSQEIKLPEPIIFEPYGDNRNQQNNLSLTSSNDENKQDQLRQNIINNTDAKEMVIPKVLEQF